MKKWSLIILTIIKLIYHTSYCQDNFVFPSNTPVPKYNPNDAEFKNFITKIGNIKSTNSLKNYEENNHNNSR